MATARGYVARRRPPTAYWTRETRVLFVVHGTKKFLDRVGRPSVEPDEASTALLGNWYATALLWKPQVALFVSEPTLLPVLMLLAPAATVVDRFPAALSTVLEAHEVAPGFVAREMEEMTEHRLSRTKNRSVVGITNEFAFLGREYRLGDGTEHLVELSLRLAEVPCSPLYESAVTPAGELAALVSARFG